MHSNMSKRHFLELEFKHAFISHSIKQVHMGHVLSVDYMALSAWRLLGLVKVQRCKQI